MISEGQRNDINYAIPLLDQIEINGSNVLADRGYDRLTEDMTVINYLIMCTPAVESQPFHPERELNLNVIVIGGYTKNAI